MIDLRRLRLVFTGLILLGLPTFLMAQEVKMYVGTYTSPGGSQGVQLYDFNIGTGQSTFLNSIPLSNPSFLAKRGSFLYVVNEDVKGMVTAVNLASNEIVNSLPTNGAHPCHVALSPTMPVVAVSNYSGGSLALFSISEEGSLRKQEDFIQFKGGSVNKERQSSAHIHSAFFSKDGKSLYVSDLGTDLIYVYNINKNADGYSLKEINRISVKKGGGPRHLVLANNGNTLYAVLELTGELGVYKIKNGVWKNEQLLPIYAQEFNGEQGAADIKMSRDGRFIYATNRGDANVIVCYAVKKNGALKLKSITSTGGVSPRNLNLSECERWLFVTNQLSNEVMTFRRDVKNGSLKVDESAKIGVSKPVCVLF